MSSVLRRIVQQHPAFFISRVDNNPVTKQQPYYCMGIVRYRIVQWRPALFVPRVDSGPMIE